MEHLTHEQWCSSLDNHNGNRLRSTHRRNHNALVVCDAEPEEVLDLVFVRGFDMERLLPELLQQGLLQVLHHLNTELGSLRIHTKLLKSKKRLYINFLTLDTVFN